MVLHATTMQRRVAMRHSETGEVFMRRGIFFGLVTILFWSSAFVGIRVGLRAFSPWHLVLLRFLTASAVLLVGMLATHGRLIPPRRAWARVFLSGLTGFTIYHTALTLGERTVPANTASFIIAAAPLFSSMLGRVFLREQVRVLGWVGMGISFVGVGVLSGFGGGLHWNALLIVLSAASTAVYFVLEKPLLAEFRALDVTAWVTWAGTLPMLAYAGGLDAALQRAALYPLLAVLYIGVFPAAIAYVTWSMALFEAQVSRVAPLLYLSPILASGIAWVVLGERPGWGLAGGGILILAGVWIIQTQAQRPSSMTIKEGVG